MELPPNVFTKKDCEISNVLFNAKNAAEKSIGLVIREDVASTVVRLEEETRTLDNFTPIKYRFVVADDSFSDLMATVKRIR
jgi:hypothetical protein